MAARWQVDKMGKSQVGEQPVLVADRKEVEGRLLASVGFDPDSC